MDLDQFLANMRNRAGHMLGYPINCNSVCADALKPFLGLVLNNLGDPFEGSIYGVNTMEFERQVVAYLANLFHLHANDAWGYVTASGSEGNWRGLSIGLRKFPNAVIYCTEKAHYSVLNACEMMRSQPVVIPCGPDHTVQLPCVDAMLDPSRPAVFCLTAGTTIAGAIDPIQEVIRIFQERQVPHYIHVDAALSGLILPFLQGSPSFDFSLPIDSLSVSGVLNHCSTASRPSGGLRGGTSSRIP